MRGWPDPNGKRGSKTTDPPGKRAPQGHGAAQVPGPGAPPKHRSRPGDPGPRPSAVPPSPAVKGRHLPLLPRRPPRPPSTPRVLATGRAEAAPEEQDGAAKHRGNRGSPAPLPSDSDRGAATVAKGGGQAALLSGFPADGLSRAGGCCWKWEPVCSTACSRGVVFCTAVRWSRRGQLGSACPA